MVFLLHVIQSKDSKVYIFNKRCIYLSIYKLDVCTCAHTQKKDKLCINNQLLEVRARTLLIRGISNKTFVEH